MTKIEITPDLLRELLDYSPDTGQLLWKPREGAKNWNTRWAGRPALAYKDTNDYLYGRVFAQRIYAHRAAYMIYHGIVPNDVDHINGDRADNRISNLRSATRSENLRNRSANKRPTKSGIVGVYLVPSGRWQVYICQKSLGTFATKEEAIHARRAAEAKMGFSPRHGSSSPSRLPRGYNRHTPDDQ